MTPKLYIVEASPAVRAVLLLVKAIDVDIDLVPIDFTAGEHKTPEFLKINPQHTVPTLEDDGFSIWDSHAINIYLTEKYAPDDSLYPADQKKRAVINQRLHFDSGILFPELANALRPILRDGVKTIPQDKIDNVTAGYAFLETFLEGNKYVAGDYLSIADFSIITSITTTNLFIPVDKEKYPNILAWISRMKSLAYYEAGNQIGLDKLDLFVKAKLAE